MLVALGLLGCTGTDLEPGQIGPDGGTVSEGGVRLIVPEGAVAEPTTFRIVDTGQAVPAPWEGFTNVIAFEPADFVFDVPVRLEVDVAAADLGLWSTASDGFSLTASSTAGGVLSAEITTLAPRFVGPPTLRVDEPAPFPPSEILFVVERTRRTKDVRAQLAAEAQALVDLLAWDVRIGVTTMVETAPDFGRLREVDGVRFLDGETPDPAARFASMLDGNTSGEPMGRSAAWTVIADPAPEDVGFTRGGRLDLVFVSPQEDLSPNDPVSRAEFVAWMQGFGPTAQDTTAHGAYYIPGTPCASARPPAGSAYNNYINQSEGEKTNICAPEWADFLTRVGDRTRDSARVVVPGPAVEAPTVSLRGPDGIERALEPADTRWDPDTSTVYFDQGVRPLPDDAAIVRWLPLP